MKVKKLLTGLIPKKKKLTPLQKIMQTVTPKKKKLPLLKKKLTKKWHKSSLRKTMNAKGKKTMMSFKKGAGRKILPATILARMP